jgi:hypothetical protein
LLTRRIALVVGRTTARTPACRGQVARLCVFGGSGAAICRQRGGCVPQAAAENMPPCVIRIAARVERPCRGCCLELRCSRSRRPHWPGRTWSRGNIGFGDRRTATTAVLLRDRKDRTWPTSWACSRWRRTTPSKPGRSTPRLAAGWRTGATANSPAPDARVARSSTSNATPTATRPVAGRKRHFPEERVQDNWPDPPE